MKVLLINPPDFFDPLDHHITVVSGSRGYSPPLGLLYVAAFAEQYGHHRVEIIDGVAHEDDSNSLRRKIRKSGPDVVGIQTMTMTLLNVVKTIELVKEVDKSIKIVLGGPHVHLYPEETIQLEGVDYLVLGEGEETFKQLLDYIDDKSKLVEVKGLVYKNGEIIVNTGKREPIRDLDGLPYPARRITDIQKYTSVLAKRNPITTIFSSRGCPFSCAFCDRPHLGRKFRSRSAKNVVDELEQCVNMGIRDFLFYDDTFTVIRSRVLEICDEIKKRKLEIGFDIRARVDTVDEELVRKLKRAGCAGIHYGVEAGSERMLKVLQKGITLDQVKKAFDFTKKQGVPTLAYFMIGNPSETLKEIHQTFDLMYRLSPDYMLLNILCPFPGTLTYQQALSKGILQDDCWKRFAQNPTDTFVPPYWSEIFRREELEALVVKGYKNFYFRPSYVLNRLLHTKSLTEASKKAAAALRLAMVR